MYSDPIIPSMSEAVSNAVHKRPLDIYRHDVDTGIIMADAAQAQAMEELDAIHARLLRKWQAPQTPWQKLRRRFGLARPPAAERGLYLWGGVGRGKTYLMDLFFHALPGERKMRMHFHRFMLMVHRRLAEQSGQSNPLVQVAEGIAADVDVICFDEFHVADIGDAMILANLLDTLFSAGVTLVTTSNIEPDRLYERGLQRQMFLPAIALLKRHTKVLNVDGGIDYRLRSLDKVAVFHWPLGPTTDTALQALFADLTRGLHVDNDKVLAIQQRKLTALRWSEGQVWFDFEMLCGGPRGAADYIEIAGQYHTVFVSGVPVLHESSDDKARRFITMVDEFYDHGVKLVLAAATDIDSLYQGVELQFPFARTRSRLREMQTREYLGSAHTPD